MLPLYPPVRKWSLEDHCTFPSRQGVVNVYAGCCNSFLLREDNHSFLGLSDTREGEGREGPFYFDLSSIPAVGRTNGPTNRLRNSSEFGAKRRRRRRRFLVERKMKALTGPGPGEGEGRERRGAEHGHSGGAAASYISRQDRRTHLHTTLS